MNLSDKICCPLCKGYNIEKKFSLNDYSNYICKECYLGFTYPIPTEKQLIDYYNNSYFSSDNFLTGTSLRIGYKDYLSEKKIHLDNAKYIMKKASRFWNKPPGLLCEIGCASGFLLDHARSQGWKVKGIDLSQEGVDFAQNSLGLDVIKGDIFSLKADSNSFDICIAQGVMDHLINPLAAFDEIFRILKPEGLFIMTIGDISGSIPFQWRPPEHLFYFSRKSLKLALEKSGFGIKKYQIFWTKYSFGEFLNRFNYYVKILKFPTWIYRLPFGIRVPTNEVFIISQKPMI